MRREELMRIHKEMYVDNGFFDPDLRLMLQIGEDTLERRLGRGCEGDPFDDGCLEMVGLYNAEALDLLRGRSVFAGNTEVINANWPVEVVKEGCLRLVAERLGIEEDKEGKRRRVEY